MMCIEENVCPVLKKMCVLRAFFWNHIGVTLFLRNGRLSGVLLRTEAETSDFYLDVDGGAGFSLLLRDLQMFDAARVSLTTNRMFLSKCPTSDADSKMLEPVLNTSKRSR
jgi:hypothetical protein